MTDRDAVYRVLSRYRALIDEYGWALVGVFAAQDQEPAPSFTYTVGLFESYAHPELIVVGLPIETAKSILNDLGGQIRDGRRFEVGARTELNGRDGSLDGEFVALSEPAKHERITVAHALYGTWIFPALQLVWPDEANRLPWEEGFNPAMVEAQPVLGKRSEGNNA